MLLHSLIARLLPPFLCTTYQTCAYDISNLCCSIFGPWDGITAAQNATIETVSESLTETFGSPAYYNEEYPADDDFSGVQWGSNYPRLLSIKKALDPKGVFSCRNCVGSEKGF